MDAHEARAPELLVSQKGKRMNDTGENFSIEDDEKILKINSPRENVKGPYVVVYKNIIERWAIIAFDWDDKPRLGMRWFKGNGGNPFSSGHGTWLVIPPSLSRILLLGLPIDHRLSNKIDDFLAGKICGNEIND